MFKYFLYKIGLFLLYHFPQKLSYRLAAFISDIQCSFSFRDRRSVRRNLKNIVSCSSEEMAFLTRDVFRNFGRYLIEFFQMKEMVDAEFVRNKVAITGLEHLDKVVAEGKGGILVTAHIGNWELGVVVLGVLGYPLTVVALPHKERPVNDLFNQQREIRGTMVVPTNVAVRKCIKQLREKKLVALVADRDFNTSGIVMDFLGRKAIVPKGPALFSWKTGAPIIPTFLIRNQDGTFNLSFHAPIYPPGKDVVMEKDQIILGIMRQYVPIIERQIRAYPSQWLVFREFFVK